MEAGVEEEVEEEGVNEEEEKESWLYPGRVKGVDCPWTRPYGSLGEDGRYEMGGKLGSGSFGVVYRALDRVMGREVALKEVQCVPESGGGGLNLAKCAFRELNALRQLEGGEHVLRLLDVRTHGSAVVLVLELAATNLEELLQVLPTPMHEAEVKEWSRQLLEGLRHVHGRGLMHRDIKPGNLLISDRGVLKLADFGLARVYACDDDPRAGSFSHQVATRWYRAPELMYGSRAYGPAVDLWGAGCVVAEMALHSPLFPGQSDIDQLARILEVFGSPISEETWPSASLLPDFSKIIFKEMAAKPFEKVFLGVTDGLISLLRELLVLDPSRRTPAACLLDASDCFRVAPLPCRVNMTELQELMLDAKGEGESATPNFASRGSTAASVDDLLRAASIFPA